MKRILLFFSLCIGLSFLPNGLYAQCTPVDATCSMAAGQFDNVVIGEISGDAGQSDGANDAIVEIVGPPGTMIGCMLITDTEWAVLIPAGTVIPADGVFSIGCLNGMGTGVGITGGINGLVAGGIGDFNAGLPIDFDVCDPANANYYDPAASGFTLDNTGAPGSLNGDGEQVFLFLPNGTPHDGLYWDGGGTGNADHASASMGMDYTLGDNDGNGTVNDVATTVPGKRGDGGNATAVPLVPVGDGTECPCNSTATPGTFTVPGIGSASDDNGMGGPLWTEIIGTDHVGCNSSFIRLNVGTSAGGADGSSNASHTDGEVESSTMDGMGQNLDNGGGATGGITSEGFDPTSFTPSACGDASGEWAYTDHPTPGEANDDPTFVFFADQTVLCAPGMVTFTAEVYNWQHVEDMVVSTNQGNNKTGSYVIDETGAQVAWTSITPSGGVNETTTLIFTTGVLPVGTHTFTLVWDDWTDCCGTTGLSTVNECYESETFTITVAEPFTLSSTNITCPGDFDPGFIDVSTLIATGASNPLVYDLQYNAISQEMNTTGLFNIVTAATDPITVVVSDPAGCTPPVVVSIDPNCKAAPPCPEITGSMMDDADGVICPGDQVCFDMTAFDNLPDGGTIDFYSDPTNTFDPYAGEGTLLGSADINMTGGITYVDCAGISAGDIAFTYASVVDEDFCFVLLNNIASGTTIYFTDSSYDGASFYVNEGGYVGITFGQNTPAGTQICMDGGGNGNSNGSFVCGNTGADIFLETNWTGSASFNLNNGGDQIFAYCGDDDPGVGTLIAAINLDSSTWIHDVGELTESSDLPPGLADGVNAISVGNTASGTGSNENDEAAFNCATPPNGTCAMVLSALTDDTNWDAGSTVASPGCASCSITITDKGGAVMTTVDQFCFTFDASYCNQSANGDFFIKAIINPFSEFDDPTTPGNAGDPNDCFDEDAERFELFAMNMSCPEAVLAPAAIDVCAADAPGGADLTVNLSGLATGNYSLVYAIDGVAQPAISVAAPATTATINIPTPTAGEVKVTLVSIFNDADGNTAQDPGECSGTVMGDEVCVNIRPMATVEITASTDPTTCAPADGTITITGTAGVTFDIEYSGGTLTGVTLPFMVTGLGPGTYEITGALDEGGCPVTINGTEVVLVAPGASTVSATDPAPICDAGGTGMIDLSTLAMLDGNGTDGGTLTCYGVDPRIVPSAMPLASCTVGATGTYYIEYNEGGCISYAEVNVTINPDPVASTDFVVAACSGNGNTAVDVNIMVSGGTADYMVVGLGDSETITADGTAVLTPTATSPSIVTITDANGCMTTVDLSAYVADCLPVELNNFSGKLVNDVVELKWNTSSELNNSHFVVERSLDGAKFVELGKVQGAGTTVEPQAYSFIDAQPKQINYYRLKQVDFDGTYAYSIIILINATGDDLGTKVFPVPTSETLVVETAHLIDQVKILDITGRVVLVENVAATTRVELNVHTLAAGAYFVAVQAERGVEMIRFVKQ